MQPLSNSLPDFITSLVEAEGEHPISVMSAIQKIRTTFPGLPESDEELTASITARAAYLGLGVEFDSHETGPGGSAG